jgi:photosystem II stability/assembly factor-like uncharacterized protein
MKYFSTVALFVFLFTLFGFSQPAYQWVLKRSGSSLGGPVDYNQFNPNIVYYGSNSTVYKSTDRGETFVQAGTNVPTASEIKCILVDDYTPGTYLVAIESSPDKIMKTTDDGQTWTTSLDNASFSYFGIPMTQDPSHLSDIYTMNGTSFLRSTDFGGSWTTLSTNTGSNSAPCDIEVFPDTSIILIGDNGTGIFRSTDYGVTWASEYSVSGEIPTIAIDYTNPGVAWATKWGGGGGLLKSTDYGDTWTLQSTFNGYNMWGVHAQPTDGNVVIAGCYSCGSTWRTKNSGQTWTQINISSSNYQISIVDSMTQFAAQSGGFYKLESEYFVPVELASFNASVANEEIILNWVTASELNNQGFEVERSFDNENYSKIGFVPGFGTTTEVKSYNFTVPDAPAGIQYYRLKQIDFDGSYTYYGSIEVDGPVPSDFALYQNHPNPFNPSTKISFSLPVEANVKIKLFNMLGQAMGEIVNSNFQPGTHNVDFIAEGLSSGAYIYSIEVLGMNGMSFSSTKKMLLMK